MSRKHQSIAEDHACALYSLIEGARKVHFGCTLKPHLQMSRRIRKGGYQKRLRKGKVWWFADKTMARRVHRDVCALMAKAGKRKAGDNRCPVYDVDHMLFEAAVIQCAQEANIEIIKDRAIYRARGLRDARILRKIGRGFGS